MAQTSFFGKATAAAKLSESALGKLKDELRVELIALQQRIRAEARSPVIIVLAGVQGAGVIDSLNLLNSWMDPRWIRTHAFDAPSDEERERPPFWRYWRSLPAAGTIGLYLDGWYGDALSAYCRKQENSAAFGQRLSRIKAFEHMLAADGALVIKFWLHLSKAQQRKTLDNHRVDALTGFRASDNSWLQPAPYDPYTKAAARALKATSTAEAPWHLIDGADDAQRRARLLILLRDALKAHKKARHKAAKGAAKAIKHAKAEDKHALPHRHRGALDKVDLGKTLSEAAYAKAFHLRQAKLYDLHKKARAAGLSTVIAFEGWDAAGKGGAIRRLSYALSAKNYQVVPIAAPNDEEQQHHYLWRFWRHISRAGRVTLFDRTWYGRVLVERVEHLIPPEAWARAYGEINDFEEHLTAHGIVLVKLWLHIDPEEQLRRFKEREATAHKRWKITPDDWRNRKRWDRYAVAVNDMVAATNGPQAPWHLVPATDKRAARIMIFDIVIKALEWALKNRKVRP